MAVIQDIVTSAEQMLTSAARSTFLSLVDASGTLVGYMAVLAVALVGINMMVQLRPMAWGHCLMLMIKLALIGIFAWNWTQFWAVADAIQKAIEAAAGGILAASGNGFAGPTITGGFASAIDTLMSEFTEAATSIASEMGGWFATAIVSGICLLLIAVVSAVSALLILFPKIVITILLGLAPIMIAMTLFEITKDFFERWLAACVSWSLYPLFIAAIFSIMLSMGNDMIAKIGTDGYDSIGAFIPFIVLMVLILICMALLPTLVSSVSGNMQLLGVMAVAGRFGQNAAGTSRTVKAVGNASLAAGRAPIDTFKGQNAVGRAGVKVGAGVAATVNRMQERANSL